MFAPLGFMAPAAAAPAGTAIVGAGSFAGTLTRASSATYANAGGIIVPAASNVARFQGAAGRLLVERDRSNLIPSTAGVDPWVMAWATNTAGATTGPDGTASAGLLSAQTANDRHNTEIFAYVPSYSSFALTGYFKAAGYNVQLTAASGGGRAYAYFDLTNGVLGDVAALSAYSSPVARITPATNGFYRCELRYFTTDGEVFASVNLSDRLTHTGAMVYENPAFVGNGGGVYHWGVQLEAGGDASSIIPSTTAPTSRAGDDAIYIVSPAQSVGTVTGAFLVPSLWAGETRLINLLYNAGGEELHLFLDGLTLTTGRWNGSDWQPATLGAATAGTLNKFALGWSGGTASISVNGAAAVALTGVSTTGYSKLAVGGRGDSSALGHDQLNGEIGPVTLYPTRMTDTQLAAAST